MGCWIVYDMAPVSAHWCLLCIISNQDPCVIFLNFLGKVSIRAGGPSCPDSTCKSCKLRWPFSFEFENVICSTYKIIQQRNVPVQQWSQKECDREYLDANHIILYYIYIYIYKELRFIPMNQHELKIFQVPRRYQPDISQKQGTIAFNRRQTLYTNDK